MQYVYVLNKHGEPLMPCSPRKARLLLKQKKACVIKRTPFTIKLLYGSTGYKQPVTLGVDAGSKHIGISATTEKHELYREEATPRNDVVDLLSARRAFRRSRRNRKTRYRAPRFDNRVHSKHKGWLAPSVEVKIQEHITLVEHVCRILPVTLVRVETAEFDTQRLKAMLEGKPLPVGTDYQLGEIEKSRDVKEWHGLTKDIAERFAREFMAERNPGRWSGFGEVPESVSLDPLNFPINDIYPKGNKPALRMQLISVTYPSLHRVCECSIIEDGVDLWARRTLDSMTAGTVEDLVETVLYVARMYERSKCFERIYVNRIQMEKSEYDAILRHLNDPDSIDDEYRISDVVFAADNTTVSVLWEGNSKDGVSGTVTLAVNGKTVYATKSTKVFCNHWILPYNSAEYHVLVDVLPKKTVLEETIYVSKPYAERIKKYLRGAEVQGDGSSLSKTAKFSNGFEMDIRCCGGKDDSWTEAILYDNTGKEVVVTEPCDGFTGCWELKDEDTNTVYRAHVMTKSNLN